MCYWWMSFCDRSRPKGDMFLGALIVRADSESELFTRSWMLGLNPGGEALFYEIPKQYHERIPSDWIETRLITREESEKFEKRWSN